MKWDKLNPGLKELAAMVSGNGGRDSKEELEKLYLKKRIEQTEAKTEMFRDKYLDKEEVIQWCEASYSQLSARLQQLFATIAPKLQGLTAAQVQSRLSREIPVVFKSLRELQRTVQTSSKK